MAPTPSFASLQYGLPYSIWQAIIKDCARRFVLKLYRHRINVVVKHGVLVRTENCKNVMLDSLFSGKSFQLLPPDVRFYG